MVEPEYFMFDQLMAKNTCCAYVLLNSKAKFLLKKAETWNNNYNAFHIMKEILGRYIYVHVH